MNVTYLFTGIFPSAFVCTHNFVKLNNKSTLIRITTTFILTDYWHHLPSLLVSGTVNLFEPDTSQRESYFL